MHAPSRTILGFALAALALPQAARGQDGPPPSAAVQGPTKAEYRERRKALMEQLRTAEAATSVMRSTLLRAEGAGGPAPAGAAGVVVAIVGGASPARTRSSARRMTSGT